MMGGIKAQWDCIKALSETEFFDDLKVIDVPVLVMRYPSSDLPIPHYGSQISEALEGNMKSPPGNFHGMPTTHADLINADLLEFIKS